MSWRHDGDDVTVSVRILVRLMEADLGLVIFH